jgi:hypothetical protein
MVLISCIPEERDRRLLVEWQPTISSYPNSPCSHPISQYFNTANLDRMPSVRRKRTLSSRPPITPHTSGRRQGLRAPSSRAPSVSSGLYQTPINPSASQLRTPHATDANLETDRFARVTDDDFDDHVIAAIDTKDYATVGCAYYSAQEEKMYLLSDCRSGGMETVDACRSFYHEGSAEALK